VTGFDPDQISLAQAHNFIDGRPVKGRGAAIAVRRPSDGRVQADLDSVDADQLVEAVDNAQAAYKRSGWAQTDAAG
jgi:aldehyde dehydrogenase (NAD+)